MTDPTPQPALGSTSLDFAARLKNAAARTAEAAACPYCADYRPLAGTDCTCSMRCDSGNCQFPAAEEFDGCSRDCREGHTYEWGRCELGTQPPPRLSYARQFTSDDGEFGVGFDSVLLERLVPWTASLPAADQHEMLAEFFDADDADRDAVIAAWRTTAEQLADPDRRDVLLGDHDPADYVEAERPLPDITDGITAVEAEAMAMFSMTIDEVRGIPAYIMAAIDDMSGWPTPEEFADFDAAIAECRGDGIDWKARAERAEAVWSARTEAARQREESWMEACFHDRAELEQLRARIAEGADELKRRATGGLHFAGNIVTFESGFSEGIRTAYRGAAEIVGAWRDADDTDRLPSRDQVERQAAHARWEDLRDARMDSPAARDAYDAAAREYQEREGQA